MLLVLCVSSLALGLTACANASKSEPAPARDARVAIAAELGYLKAAQNADGGFGASPGQPSSELYTAWAAMGLAAAGRSPAQLTRDGHSVLDALRGEAASLHGAGDLERTILALHACGVSVRSLPGGDPVARLLSYRASDGSFSHLSNLTAFAILSLRAAAYGPRSPRIAAAASWLARQQEGDGSFGYGARGAGGDIDDTAAALQALHGAGARYAQGAGARRRVPAPRPEPRRRLPAAARRPLQRPVHGLGGPGLRRRRGERREGDAERQPQPARVSRDARGAGWERALLAHRRADARVGDRTGADGLRRAPAADRPGLGAFQGRLSRISTLVGCHSRP